MQKKLSKLSNFVNLDLDLEGASDTCQLVCLVKRFVTFVKTHSYDCILQSNLRKTILFDKNKAVLHTISEITNAQKKVSKLIKEAFRLKLWIRWWQTFSQDFLIKNEEKIWIHLVLKPQVERIMKFRNFKQKIMRKSCFRMTKGRPCYRLNFYLRKTSCQLVRGSTYFT